ncbi:MAG TPA: insulinase family protein [Ilumatobacteraceae bacterium]
MSNGWRRAQRARRLVLAVLVAGQLAVSCSTDPGVTAREATPIDTVETEQIPIESEVRLLTLDNGLTVYIRANDRPGGSAEMRLVINAGSGQEDADQIGVAHFLEHMMFNGTEQFPANKLVDTLRGFGMQFGADVNAYTSYDETVYQLTVPMSDEGNETAALDVLREWLSAATLSTDEVDKEKGVILDEWRQSDQTHDGRIGKSIENMLLGSSEYNRHDPIGTDAAINAMTSELLRRFYDTWYRPDNAAIVVVGDIDVDQVESEIRDRFESLTPRGDTATRSDPALGRFDAPDAWILSDADATTATVEVMVPHDYAADGTIASLRRDTLQSLAFDMIATRLSDDVSRGTASFTSASASNEGLVRWLDAPSVVVDGEIAQLQDELDALLLEFERVRRFGFNESELDRALRGYRGAAQAQLDGSDTVQDLELASRYVDHFLTKTPVPNADAEFQLSNTIYDEVTVEAVNTAYEEMLSAAALHVLVVAPESATDVPSREDVLVQIAALPSLHITDREATAAVPSELMTPPAPVEETNNESLDGDGIFVTPTMLTFANGARFVLNPTDIADNDIYFSATSPGGLSLVADADVTDALNAVAVVTTSGIGDLDPVALDTVLSDAQVELYPAINPTSETFVGTATGEDLELLLQMVHLFFTSPRFDPVAFDASLSQLRPYVENPSSDPDLAAYIAFSEERYGTEPRFEVIPSEAELDSIDLEGIERVWRQRFSNAGDWVFALSGDFDLADGKELARRYIGTLDGDSTREEFKDYQQDPPSRAVTREVRAGTGDKGSVTFDWSAPTSDSDTEQVYADVLTSVLNIRLTDHIREELGASYSPTAYVSVSDEPDHLIESYLNVTGDPERITELSAFVIDDISELRADGPHADELDAAVAELTDTYQYFDNQTIGDLLTLAPDRPELVSRFRDRPQVLGDITAATLQAFIADVLPLDRYIEIRTLPA